MELELESMKAPERLNPQPHPTQVFITHPDDQVGKAIPFAALCISGTAIFTYITAEWLRWRRGRQSWLLEN